MNTEVKFGLNKCGKYWRQYTYRLQQIIFKIYFSKIVPNDFMPVAIQILDNLM